MAAVDQDLIWIGVEADSNPKIDASRTNRGTAGSSRDQRWSQYRRLLMEAGCYAVYRSYWDGSVFFAYSARGLVPRGSVKGYAHVLESPPMEAEGWFRYDQSRELWLKRFSGNWYLFCSGC
jgi:hypothetical protein